ALQRIGELYAIEAEVRGCSAEQRLAARKARAAPLMQSLYDWIWALLRRQAELDGMPAINAKRVYRIMRQNALLLERKTAVPPSKRAHTGKVAVKESNQRWCSDGFEF
ncbi:IS66 family transposase, partial [Escherichia coli]|uniref:IS66 family transposase n=1 Tax=Escherichia coli TaxID=562 RepID=UPI00228290A2